MIETVAIVGVGLIGGSFGLALRAAGFRGRILGVSSPATVEAAITMGAIDAGTSLEGACAQADVVYLASPISVILNTIPKLDALIKPGALITDAGSTKQVIAAAGANIRRGVFLGGHPMAGKESRGVASADARLFQDRPYLLTPSRPEDLSTPITAEFVEWLRRIGATVQTMPPEEHDLLVGLSSHLPQLASTALASLLSRHPDSARVAAAAGPGLVDMTRLALSSWEIWRDILATNSKFVLTIIDSYKEEIEILRDSIANGSADAEFRNGRTFSESVPRKKHNVT